MIGIFERFESIGFISLHSVLESITLPLPATYPPQDAEDMRTAKAAAILHSALTTGNTPPAWLRINESTHLTTSTDSTQGLKILECVATYPKRHMAAIKEANALCDHLKIDVMALSDDGIAEYMAAVPLYCDGMDFYTAGFELGFNQAKIGTFLNANKIPHTLGFKPTRSKGDEDAARTAHVTEWVKRTEYTGGTGDKQLNDIFQKERPGLWGKENNVTTFRKWIQLPEAKALLPNTRRR